MPRFLFLTMTQSNKTWIYKNISHSSFSLHMRSQERMYNNQNIEEKKTTEDLWWGIKTKNIKCQVEKFYESIFHNIYEHCTTINASKTNWNTLCRLYSLLKNKANFSCLSGVVWGLVWSGRVFLHFNNIWRNENVQVTRLKIAFGIVLDYETKNTKFSFFFFTSFSHSLISTCLFHLNV